MQPPAVLIAAIKDLWTNAFQNSIDDNFEIRKHATNGQKVSKSSRSSEEMRRIQSLTSREREIISLVGQGLKNKDIANKLSISDITVRHHLTNIFCKLEVSDRQKLLILAHRNGLANLILSSVEPA
jgi:DNA-binding NarL/FixJ family response regulator